MRGAKLYREMCHRYDDPKASQKLIREGEHRGDELTHEIIHHRNTTFVTPIDREDIRALASGIDDISRPDRLGVGGDDPRRGYHRVRDLQGDLDRQLTLPDGLVVRTLEPGDSIAELTEMLHRAYAGLAEMGLRYLATHQSEETTAKRAAGGECIVGVLDGALVATVTFCVPARTGGCAWYDRDGVASFQQFCVDPAFGRRGIGARLMDLVEMRAAECGASEIACDTAEAAVHLIRMYERRGYRVVGRVDWRPVTNYPSVVLSKPIG